MIVLLSKEKLVFSAVNAKQETPITNDVAMRKPSTPPKPL